ncbi:sporulation membrane protein YtaF [Lysinibacillus xylanilyticus]|uniref:sporulation membrane protein YtaF n=1 Tax=Lysinibacillus xylanilyticus TaxID=582475 RepID=UPI002E1E581F|nr:sporulation membrane protein YtaF [Lysinibacillus xylanilyticus]
MTWLIIFTFSSSIDNLGVGLSYGIRKINVRFDKNILISVICFIMSMAGITFGVWLSIILPGILPVVIGAVLLCIIGIRIILLAKPRKQETSIVDRKNEMQSNNNVQDILRNPEEAHFNKSGEIGWGEAVLLGIALAANALTNGVGAGLLGLSPLVISILAAIGSFITVWLGVKLGSKVADVRIGSFTVGQFGTIISGVMLLIIAFAAFF